MAGDDVAMTAAADDDESAGLGKGVGGPTRGDETPGVDDVGVGAPEPDLVGRGGGTTDDVRTGDTDLLVGGDTCSKLGVAPKVGLGGGARLITCVGGENTLLGVDAADDTLGEYTDDDVIIKGDDGDESFMEGLLVITGDGAAAALYGLPPPTGIGRGEGAGGVALIAGDDDDSDWMSCCRRCDLSGAEDDPSTGWARGGCGAGPLAMPLGVDTDLNISVGGEGGVLDDRGWGEEEDGDGDLEEGEEEAGGGGGVLVDIGS